MPSPAYSGESRESRESRESTHEPPEGWHTALIYIAAGVVYVSIGVFVPELLFSWFEGVPFLVIFIWLANRVVSRRASMSHSERRR